VKYHEEDLWAKRAAAVSRPALGYAKEDGGREWLSWDKTPDLARVGAGSLANIDPCSVACGYCGRRRCYGLCSLEFCVGSPVEGSGPFLEF